MYDWQRDEIVYIATLLAILAFAIYMAVTT